MDGKQSLLLLGCRLYQGILNFVRRLFSICSTSRGGCPLLQRISRSDFSDAETALHSWDKLHLVTVYNVLKFVWGFSIFFGNLYTCTP